MSSLDKLVRKAKEAYDNASWIERRGMDAAQRRSWALGQILLVHPEMTYAEAERLVDHAIEGEKK